MRPESLIGVPTSCAMVAPSSAARALSPSEIFCRNSARCAAGDALQPSNAARAAATAASMSFSPPAGTVPMTAPVPALWTSIVSFEAGAIHWPLMKNFSRAIMQTSKDEVLILAEASRYTFCMPHSSRAVICRELNKQVVVETISVDGPKRGELTVKLAACGVCHSDLSATNRTIPLPPPLVLGHEGAGEVVEVGEGVSGIAVGDHVVTSFIYMCGKCRYCAGGRPVLCIEQGRALTTPPEGTPRTRDKDGKPLNIFSGCGVRGEYATLSGGNEVNIDTYIP